MAQAKRAPMMGRRDDSATVGQMAKDAGAAPKRVDGVSKLSDGRLKMVGVPHDAKIGMVIPRSLSDAWAAEAKAQGRSKTDLFEDMMLTYLKKHGWEIGG